MPATGATLGRLSSCSGGSQPGISKDPTDTSGTAAEVLGVAPEAATSEQRRFSKVINFGLIYGMSSDVLAKSLGSTTPRPRTTLNATPALPGREDLHGRNAPVGQDTGYVETVFGCRLYLRKINARVAAA